MPFDPESHRASIVLIGNFNPYIFSPAWFWKVGLFTEQQCRASDIEVIHNEITIFSMEDQTFNVQPTRFHATASKEPFLRMSELVHELFSRILPYTPLQKLGINYQVNFHLQNAAQRVALGRRLAPIEPWGDWGKTMETKDPARTGGLANLTMQEAAPSDRKKGVRRVSIEPLSKDETRRGVTMGVNDEFEVEKWPHEEGATEIMSYLEDRFEDSASTSNKIVRDLYEFSQGLDQ